MGTLEDLGRSNALTSNMQNLASMAINLRQLQNQEEQQGFTNAINMEKLGMEKAGAEREATKFQWAEKEHKAKEALLDMPVPITKYLGVDYQTDPAKKMMFDKAKEKGLIWEAAPGVVMTSERNAVEFKKYADDDLAWSKKLNETNMVKIANKVSEIGMALAEESNPKKIEELTQKKDALEKQLGVLAKAGKDMDIEHQKKLALEMAKHEGVKITHVYVDELGKTVNKTDKGQFIYPDGTPFAGDYGKLKEVGAPKEVYSPDAAWLSSWDKANPKATPQQRMAAIEKHQKETGAIRGESFAHSRPVNVLDTKNGNAPTILSLADVQAGNALEPGRYIPTSGGTKALGQTALIEDIRGAITNTRGSLKNLKTDFTATQAAQIAMVLKQRDPRSATSAFIGSQVGQTLTPEQVDYVTDLAQLIENGMAMRSVLGAGQGSDELRSAIMSTIPSAKTPNRAYAYKQLDKFEQQINRLSAGVPKVSLRQDVGKTTSRGDTIKSFATIGEATSAANRGEIKPGDRITVGGKTGTWE